MSDAEIVAQVITEVAERHQIKAKAILGHRRNADVCAARQELMWRLFTESGYSLSSIARLLDRDHTTIRSGIAKVRKTIVEGDEWPVRNIHFNPARNFEAGSFELRSMATALKARDILINGRTAVVVPRKSQKAKPRKRVLRPKPPKPVVFLPCTATRQADQINRYWASKGIEANARAVRVGFDIVIKSDLQMVT